MTRKQPKTEFQYPKDFNPNKPESKEITTAQVKNKTC